MEFDRPFARRAGVGVLVLALFAVVAYVAVRFIAVVVFSVFLYYAVRPIFRSLERFALPRRLRAGLALVLFGVPLVLLVGYTIAIVALEAQSILEVYDVHGPAFVETLERVGVGDFEELQSILSGAISQSSLSVIGVSVLGALGVLSSAFVQLLILVVLTYYMLVDGSRFVSWLLERFDDSGVMGEYVRAVDPELSMTLFGNIVNVFVTAIVGVATFYAYNFFAPAAVAVPFPELLGALAGVGSLIPVVGIKLVYLPVTAVLAANAWISGDLSLLVPVGILLVVSAVVVDFIPDFFIRAHISGDQTHTGMLLVSYVVGPVVFGFYGLFLLPIVLILVINATYVLVPYALSGEEPGTRQARLREYATRGGEPTAETPSERRSKPVERKSEP
ncbi:AI-2E family transporter [Halostagnicola kamekurae]|uniref:Predicted PurR-regulated permease PerM n=1 Tax=Halostagnicola kamekurae TaxID=619731 RepID=A0A1I6PRB2_9EURY|nr:AI-2E family transporter [Halostagnicola kamekurae]SFS42608.1 Predicted PurR-regulated permease PerM [Halostagnicola kamekurae]